MIRVNPPRCVECGGEMHPGRSLPSNLTVEQARGRTWYFVLKCEDCGHSILPSEGAKPPQLSTSAEETNNG